MLNQSRKSRRHGGNRRSWFKGSLRRGFSEGPLWQFLRRRRFNEGLNHTSPLNDRHRDAINGLADLLISLRQRLMNLPVGLMQCFADLLTGLVQHLLDLMSGFGQSPMDLVLSFGGSLLGISRGLIARLVPSIEGSEHLGTGPHMDMPGGREPSRYHHQEKQE